MKINRFRNIFDGENFNKLFKKKYNQKVPVKCSGQVLAFASSYILTVILYAAIILTFVR